MEDQQVTHEATDILDLISAVEVTDKYEIATSARTKHVETVLNSPSLKKIVVAGPGTGKTHLFKEVLKGKSNTLTLTFVNSLVEDLCLELNGLSDVKTLHGFARSTIAKAKKREVKIFPKLSTVVKEDAAILLGQDVDFEAIFYDLKNEVSNINFYRDRKKYYDDYYGYTDIVYALVMYFQKHPELIPIYEQIVVDEFQDFNLLEVTLIDLLSTKSPILIAGDDDQALYEFKGASSHHIRHKHSNNDPEYSSFTLPFCSRCTRVIVDGINDVIYEAKNRGFLLGRIDKPYTYFDNAEKDKVSAANPKIVHKKVYWGQVPWFIEQQIEKIAEELKGKFSVLIISPTKTQSTHIAKTLQDKGFKNVEFTEKKDTKDITLIDGLKVLLEQPESNLGWRIVSKFFLTAEEFKALLQASNEPDAPNICKILKESKKSVIKDVKEILKVLKQSLSGQPIEETDLPVFKKVGFDTSDIISKHIKEEISNETHAGNPGIRKIPIKTTTIQSSKGLAEDYVFITHFDDQYFLKDSVVTDQCICNLLVALTRAKKKVFLISTQDSPTFLKWIKEERIEEM